MHPLHFGEKRKSPHWLHPAVRAISWHLLHTDPLVSNYGTLQNIQMHEVGSCSTRTPETVPKGNAGLHSTPRAVNFQGLALKRHERTAHVKGLCALLDRVVQNLHSPTSPYFDCHSNQYNTWRMAHCRLTQHFCDTGLCFMAVVSNRH